MQSKPRKSKSRGNGQGCAYLRGKTWEAQVVIGYKPPNTPGGAPIPIKRRKGGFPTKKAAIAACPGLLTAKGEKYRLTLQQLYDAWYPFYEPRVGPSTMVNYRCAFKHFSPLHNTYIDLITAGDLQDCLDACPAGKRTHENMKAVAGLLWAYASDHEYVLRDITENLYIGKGETQQRDPITEEELEIIGAAIPQEPFASYVYAMAYLGFRPSEFLGLKKSDLRIEKGLLVLTAGSKTDAGRDRQVPVPPIIGKIIADRMSVSGTDLLFPQYIYSRKSSHDFLGFKLMGHEYFNKHIFQPLCARLGIAAGKTPYCARHSYADKLKRAQVDDKTKAALIGHTDYAFTQSHYQSTDIVDLKDAAASIR